jgi:ribosomal protein S18 acetylase RimI-like enzyme
VHAGLTPLLSDDRRGQVWLAEDGSTPVGYAVTTWGWSLESGGLECLLDELYVRQRGAGLGSALLRQAMDAARAAGAAAMFLETEAPNDSARRFYARHGFTAEDSVWLSAPL